MNNNYLKLKDAAKYLGISKNTLYQYNVEKVIPYYKPNGKTIYYNIEDLDNFIGNNNTRILSDDEIDILAQEHMHNLEYKKCKKKRGA